MPDTLDRTAQRTADNLRAVREQWGDLLAAIDRPPVTVWPPLDCREWEKLPAEPDPDVPAEPVTGRMPLTLREHPAPLNLAAYDTARDVEESLFEQADAIAELVQRPVRFTIATRDRMDQADRDDPARWLLPTHSASVTGRAASPGSRAHGLHWAAVWLEGRALNEASGDLFRPLPLRHLDALAAAADWSRRQVERVLGRDGRRIRSDRPCPYCHVGTLTARTLGGDPAQTTVTCSTGEACSAPVMLEKGRRVWRGAELTGLYVAVAAAERRAQG